MIQQITLTKIYFAKLYMKQIQFRKIVFLCVITKYKKNLIKVNKQMLMCNIISSNYGV